jgi:hypothetical protein
LSTPVGEWKAFSIAQITHAHGEWEPFSIAIHKDCASTSPKLHTRTKNGNHSPSQSKGLRFYIAQITHAHGEWEACSIAQITHAHGEWEPFSIAIHKDCALARSLINRYHSPNSFDFLVYMKLTQRQESFVDKLIELYNELQGPIHYSVVAEKLGVSNIAAYDMLRHLEIKDEMAQDKTGPGRTRILFSPSPYARRLMAELMGDIQDKDWPAAKERFLERIHKNQMEDPEVLQEILSSVPSDEQSRVGVCTEIMTIATLHLQRSKGRKLLLDYLYRILPSEEDASRANLSLLGGFALGILTQENFGENNGMINHIRRYQSYVSDMEPTHRCRLAANLIQIFERLSQAA